MPGKWQTSVNTDGGTFSAATSSVTVDLSKANFLGEVRLRMTWLNGSTTNLSTRIEDDVDLIQILANGGAVKFFNGVTCRKMAHYSRGIRPTTDYNELAATDQIADFPLLFTRFPGDEVCVLPAKVFRTLQLKVNISMTLSDTTAYEATFAAANADYYVHEVEYISADDPTSKKILKETDVDSYTTVASGDVDRPTGGLPLGNIIRKILIYCREDGCEDGTDITHLRLGVNNFSEIPYHMRWIDRQDQESEWYRSREEQSEFLMISNTDTRNLDIGRITSINLTAPGTSTTTNPRIVNHTSLATGNVLTVALSDDAGTAVTADSQISMLVKGMAFSAWTNMIDLDPAGDLSGGIDTSNVNDVKVKVTNGGAGGTVYVTVQEVVSLV